MKKLLLVVSAVIVLGVIYGFYLFNKKTESLDKVNPDYIMTADELFMEFDKNEPEALAKYEGKVVQVMGNVLTVSQTDSISNIILSAKESMFGGVNCSFNELNIPLNKGEAVTIKGRCQGFLTSVILNNCTLIE